MVFLATRREYMEKTVVFSNCEEVEIFLNGVSVAKQRPDGGESTSYHTTGNPNWETVLRPWELDGTEVDLYDGGNCENLAHPPFTFTHLPQTPGELKAVGYIGGKAVAEDTVRTAEKPVALKVQLRLEGVPMVEEDVVMVDVLLVDQNGTVVTDNVSNVTLQAEGNAQVIGETRRTMSAGIVSFLVKVKQPDGFTLRARCKGFDVGCLSV
jgi:beta-galactosidase